MKLSRESKYGLAGLIYLARQRPGTVLAVKTVAAAQALPGTFLAKTFSRLARHGVLQSHRGGRRGYELARNPREISVREILEDIEGPDLFARCIFWSEGCSEQRPCLLHESWKAVRPQVAESLAALTLADCAAGRMAPIGIDRHSAFSNEAQTGGKTHVDADREVFRSPVRAAGGPGRARGATHRSGSADGLGAER